ncbi:hypothetical protein [Lysobacter gummosus]|uniref:hypothetical protein n=1 Tax=Lysobacter gummosus TaxID=262324 RepID=UPI003628A31E
MGGGVLVRTRRVASSAAPRRGAVGEFQRRGLARTRARTRRCPCLACCPLSRRQRVGE